MTIELLAKRGIRFDGTEILLGSNIAEAENGCHYSAESLGIDFSYGFPENEIEEYIQDAKENGCYEEMKADIEKDIYRSKHIEAFLIR